MITTRQVRLDLNSKEELAIWKAMQLIEKMGADERLTKAGQCLSDAKSLIGDYLDEIATPNNYKELFHGLTLDRFLSKEVSEGKIDFHLRATSDGKYYIHPQSESGLTFDGEFDFFEGETT